MAIPWLSDNCSEALFTDTRTTSCVWQASVFLKLLISATANAAASMISASSLGFFTTWAASAPLLPISQALGRYPSGNAVQVSPSMCQFTWPSHPPCATPEMNLTWKVTLLQSLAYFQLTVTLCLAELPVMFASASPAMSTDMGGSHSFTMALVWVMRWSTAALAKGSVRETFLKMNGPASVEHSGKGMEVPRSRLLSSGPDRRGCHQS
mmetsp:Transcript_13554/g.29792  ORF Transcript_13554/g.29792 Transcript_13554/m.29792 type:complete len:209 (+) Transcript_13554:3006-3632(+)